MTPVGYPETHRQWQTRVGPHPVQQVKAPRGHLVPCASDSRNTDAVDEPAGSSAGLLDALIGAGWRQQRDDGNIPRPAF